MFPEALRFFAVTNVCWRALPERFGKWNSVCNGFGRLTQAGIFDEFFVMAAKLSAWLAWPDSYTPFAQTLFQEDGFVITLLVAEPSEEAAESTCDPRRFRR